MSAPEPELVPHSPRWNVWTDQEAHRRNYAMSRSAVWFWMASGPRGHMSGAEAQPNIAIERAQAAAYLLEGSMQREHASRKPEGETR